MEFPRISEQAGLEAFDCQKTCHQRIPSDFEIGLTEALFAEIVTNAISPSILER